ncbi:hypothetical protein CKO31_03825 [Thiohalocapsa halophila]|uniref:Uncharacterized protein n=1 Tax=Thiohalocapsa halophila TaxID=69359 RepID=A0ABS1CDB7_9GAMM|nr:hypothetical protein [Thiohalocapsa halophila]MBK1629883.1 hypothetical protein [Thiohalocapsa halophila]
MTDARIDATGGSGVDAAKGGHGGRRRRWLLRLLAGLGLAALLLAALVLLQGGGARTLEDFLAGEWPGPAARIYVEPPQLYTRERLVNDRFREINWLEQRLNGLESVAERPPSMASASDSEQQVHLGSGRQPDDAAPATGSARAQPAPAPSLSLDQLEAFNLDFERRLAVRSEMLNTLLDDSHDLSGATLYRMNFDVSVVPKPGARGFGLVAIDVAPNSCVGGDDVCYDIAQEARLAQRVQAYRGLLGSWERDLQGFLSKVYRDRTGFRIDSGHDPFGGVPKERMAFSWYLRAKTMELWLGLLAGSDCAAGARTNGAGTDPAQAAETCIASCRRDPSGWACDAALRRDHLRRSLGLPGSRTLLAGDLSAGLERAFNEEIRRYGGQVRDKLRRRNLAAFRSELEVALQACPKPVGWRQGADCVSAEAGDAAPGADGQPEPPPAAAIQLSAKLDQGGTKPRSATQPTPGLAMREAGLDLSKRDLECIENIRACDTKQLDELYTSIVTANACRGGPLTLAWDRKHRYSIACPAVQSDQLINLYGLVRLAALLREMHRTLIQPAAVAAGDRPLLPMLPEGSTSEEVRERGRQFYETCLLAYQDVAYRCRDASAGSDDGWHGEDVDNAAQRAPGGNEPKPTSSTCSLSAEDEKLEQTLCELVKAGTSDAVDDLALFKEWFAEFFVDRLRRSDIPGFQPSPSIDRFFAVQPVGCGTGACDVMVNRRRWLSEEDAEAFGERLTKALDRLGDPPVAAVCREAGDARDQTRCEQAQWLRALLPATHQLCLGRHVDKCLDVLRESLRAAENFEVQRDTLPDVEFRSNDDQFRKLLIYQLQCTGDRVMDAVGAGSSAADAVAHCRQPLSNLEQRVAWDFATTMTALALEQRLDALGGEITVYAVEPRTKSLVGRTAVRQTRQLSASLETLPQELRAAQLQAAQRIAERLERIGARATVVGFGHLRGGASVGNDTRRASFGWILLPNHFEPQGLLGRVRPTHQAATHRLSAVLSVPSWWTSLRLTIRQCWGRHGGLDGAVSLDPYQAEAQCDGKSHKSGFAPAGTVVYDVDLPETTERITEVFDFEVIKVPYIDHRPPQEVAAFEAGRRGRAVIQGGRLWRGTMVTLNDQPADEITVLPDMKGVVATFDCVLPPAGMRHYTRNERVEAPRGDPGDAPSRAKLSVWTAQGDTFTEARIHPFKVRLPGERPCWLEQAAGALVPPAPAQHDAGDPAPEAGQQAATAASATRRPHALAVR